MFQLALPELSFPWPLFFSFWTLLAVFASWHHLVGFPVVTHLHKLTFMADASVKDLRWNRGQMSEMGVVTSLLPSKELWTMYKGLLFLQFYPHLQVPLGQGTYASPGRFLDCTPILTKVWEQQGRLATREALYYLRKIHVGCLQQELPECLLRHPFTSVSWLRRKRAEDEQPQGSLCFLRKSL